MIPVRDAIPPALAQLLRGQPNSPGKVEFAWRAVVGPAAARASTVTLDQKGVLHVSAADPHWRKELRRAVPTIQRRIAELLGDGVVRRVTFSRVPGAPATTTAGPPPGPR
jgi:predicted nucleic acid-binding Zn ribbon protein